MPNNSVNTRGSLASPGARKKLAVLPRCPVFPWVPAVLPNNSVDLWGSPAVPGTKKKKIGSAYALSGSPLSSRGSATPRHQHLGAAPPTAPVGHVVGLPLGGRLGRALVVGTPFGGPPDLFARVAPLVGLPFGSDVGLLIGRQHLGAALAVGSLLGGLAGVILGVPSLGMPVGFGLGSLVKFDVVADGRSGRRRRGGVA